MKILIKRVDNLGDVVIIIPIIIALKKKFPGVQITAMVRPQHRDVLSGYADNFIRPKKDLKNISGYNKIIEVDYTIPANYIPGNIKRTKNIRIGVKSFKRKRHVSRQLFDHLKLHGIDENFSAPVIIVEDKEKIKSEKWLKNNSVKPNDFIVTIDPGSNFSKKCWPVGYYVALCSWLINSFNAKIILPGSKEDELLQLIKTRINSDNIILLTGKKLKFVTAVINNADLHIGNDSGLGHVAAAVNTPTVTIFGPTSPVLWKPYGNKSITVFNPRVACKGGYEHAATCSIQKCLISIKPNDVADAVLASINRFIRPRSPEKFDRISLSPHLKIRRQKENILLKNNLTGHRCLIKSGWENINPILDYISTHKSFESTNRKFKDSKPLLNLFFVHRFIVPNGIAENGMYL
ncbi:MAG: glycosyltransferase family 9 protein [Bacteroidia bacterium]